MKVSARPDGPSASSTLSGRSPSGCCSGPWLCRCSIPDPKTVSAWQQARVVGCHPNRGESASATGTVRTARVAASRASTLPVSRSSMAGWSALDRSDAVAAIAEAFAVARLLTIEAGAEVLQVPLDRCHHGRADRHPPIGGGTLRRTEHGLPGVDPINCRSTICTPPATRSVVSPRSSPDRSPEPAPTITMAR